METRIIKFRAWDGFKMYEPCVWMGKEYQPMRDSFIETHLMQFTGLKDKNGIEIYEGDILKAIGESAYVVIEFKGGQFVGMNTDKNHPIQETQNRNWFQWEVIGNLYENPELLAPSYN